MRTTRTLDPALLLGLVAILAASCNQDAPDPGEMFNRFALIESAPDRGLDRAALEARLVDAIDRATFRVQAAFEDLESDAVADAIIRAQARGVDVRVVGDVDSRDQHGLTRLANELAPGPDGVPALQLGDGGLDYSPMPTVAISRTGDMNRMTHNVVVVDERRVIALSGGFPATPDCAIGADCTLPTFRQLGFDATSEDLGKDFGDELQMMFGGVFSNTLDTFGGPQKSDTNNRTHYITDSGDVELYFGPQERLLKRVIDEIYNARASVWIVSDEFANSYAAEALIYKASAGFDVRVVIEPDGGPCETSFDCPNYQQCAMNVCEVSFNAVDRLRTGFDEVRKENRVAEVRLANDLRQTIVVIDALPSPISHERTRTRVFVLSQPMTSAIAYASGQVNTPRPSDAFMDSHMWVMNALPTAPDPDVDAVVDSVRDLYDAATPATP